MKNEVSKQKQNRKYYTFYKFIKGFFRMAFRLPFGIKKKDQLVLPDEPCLVLANHCCYIDPIIVGISIKQPVNFVITENLLRNKFMAWVFTKLLHCIPCAKGGQNAQTVFDIARELRAGHNVLMYPEGNMTYDGATAEIIPSTGKLLRSLKCAVVTMQVEGAYQLLPRWSKKFCFGKVTSHIVNVYEAGTFYRKPLEKILETINRDLYIEQPAGRRDATGLECFLFACPECGQLGQITTRGRELRCACGASWIFNKYGFLENACHNNNVAGTCENSDKGESVDNLLRPNGFSALYDWNAWQQDYIKQLAAGDHRLSYSVQNTELNLISKDHKVEKTDAGTFTMTREYISCGQTRFLLREVSHMDTRDKGVLLFSLRDSSYYSVTSKDIYPGLLFKTLFAAWT